VIRKFVYLFLIKLGVFIHIPIASSQTIPIRFGTYISRNGSVAKFERRADILLLIVSSRPERRRGSATGADCELRAKFDAVRNIWELIPFSNDTMNISQGSISDIDFSIKYNSRSSFNIYTNFSQRNCAIWVSFDRFYRFVR
jgi:hypothetical protein